MKPITVVRTPDCQSEAARRFEIQTPLAMKFLSSQCECGEALQAQVRVSILANNMRFNEVLAVLAPTCVTARAGVCRRIRHAAPQIILWRKSVLEFVVHKILQEFQRVRIARVRA